MYCICEALAGHGCMQWTAAVVKASGRDITIAYNTYTCIDTYTKIYTHIHIIKIPLLYIFQYSFVVKSHPLSPRPLLPPTIICRVESSQRQNKCELSAANAVACNRSANTIVVAQRQVASRRMTRPALLPLFLPTYVIGIHSQTYDILAYIFNIYTYMYV